MELAVALIQQIISWQVVVLILAALVFRSEVGLILVEVTKHIPRIRKAGPVELDPSIQQQISDLPSVELEPLQSRAAIEPSPFAAIRILEADIERDLKAIPPEEQQARLVRALAVSTANRGHEWAYNRIFDSQLLALRGLNTRGSVSFDEARRFLAEYTKNKGFSDSHFDFDAWLLFLEKAGLVSLRADNISLTDLGQDFLVYIVQQQLPEVKGIN